MFTYRCWVYSSHFLSSFVILVPLWPCFVRKQKEYPIYLLLLVVLIIFSSWVVTYSLRKYIEILFSYLVCYLDELLTSLIVIEFTLCIYNSPKMEKLTQNRPWVTCLILQFTLLRICVSSYTEPEKATLIALLSLFLMLYLYSYDEIFSSLRLYPTLLAFQAYVLYGVLMQCSLYHSLVNSWHHISLFCDVEVLLFLVGMID